MSKLPAKAAAKPVRTTAAPTKPAAKHAAGPAGKHAAQPAPAPKAKAKPKPTAKATPAPKSAPPPETAASKPAARAPAPKTEAKAVAPKPAPKTLPAKPAAKAASPKPAAKPASKASAVKAGPSSPPPAPAPAPVSNRFTDRFAPARPAIRQMTETADLPKTVYAADPKLANAWKHKAGRDLTEPELQAMPDSEYMNEKQLEFFRARLQRQKDDLLSNAGETTEHLREDTSIVPDPADRATIEEEHALELRTRDRERKLLKKVAQSLTRLDNGDYGFCDETGEPIGLARLLARPTATLSLEAQQRRELKQKMFGD
ncbi:MAG: RNA polymerase-binding protein DksA [Rubrivivax sp.]|nr:RNA polymerase-binding protein DksA [Rubrivivax sp.]